jgi:hypothetical protein
MEPGDDCDGDAASGAHAAQIPVDRECSEAAERSSQVSWKDPRAYNALLVCCEPYRQGGKRVKLPSRAKALNHYRKLRP